MEENSSFSKALRSCTSPFSLSCRGFLSFSPLHKPLPVPLPSSLLHSFLPFFFTPASAYLATNLARYVSMNFFLPKSGLRCQDRPISTPDPNAPTLASGVQIFKLPLFECLSGMGGQVTGSKFGDLAAMILKIASEQSQQSALMALERPLRCCAHWTPMDLVVLSKCDKVSFKR